MDHQLFKLYYRDLFALNVAKKQQNVVLHANQLGTALVNAKSRIGKNIKLSVNKL